MSKRSEYPDADSLYAATCGCGLYIHPKRNNPHAIHIEDCPHAPSKLNPWLKIEEEEPSFPCVGCGACCSAVAHVPELQEKGWVLDNGVCMHLNQKTNQCAIYSQRPPVCEVMKMRPPLVSPWTWIQINLNVCDFLHRNRFEGAPPLEKAGTTCTHRKPIPKKAVPEPGDDLE